MEASKVQLLLETEVQALLEAGGVLVPLVVTGVVAHRAVNLEVLVKAREVVATVRQAAR